MELKKLNIKFIFIWTLLLVGGLAFLLYNNTHEGLWFDESISYAYSNHSIGEIIYLLQFDSHPPLYYIMLSLYTMVFGTSLFALRAFSALGILALAMLGLGPVRKLIGNKGGLVFAFLVFSTPICLSYGQEVRMYSWTAFFVTVSALYGYISLKETNKKNLILFFLALLASGYTHFYGLIAAGFIGMATFSMVLLTKDWKKIFRFLIVFAISAASFSPLAIQLIKVASNGNGVDWIPKLSKDIILATFSYPYGNKFAPPQPTLAYYAFFWSILLIGWGIFTSVRKREQNAKVVMMALAVYLSTIGFGIISSYFFRPSLIPRYMLPVLGLYLFVITFSITKLQKYTIVLVCAAILLISYPQLTNIQKNNYNGPMNDVARYVKQDIRHDDVFIHTDMHTMGVFAYYFPNNKQFFYTKDFKENIQYMLFGPNVTEGPDLKEFIKGRKNIWLVNDQASNEREYSEKWIENGDIKLLSEPKRFSYPNSWFSVSVCRVEANVK